MRDKRDYSVFELVDEEVVQAPITATDVWQMAVMLLFGWPLLLFIVYLFSGPLDINSPFVVGILIAVLVNVVIAVVSFLRAPAPSY